jgi:ketosteroid isomerase-like protein
VIFPVFWRGYFTILSPFYFKEKVSFAIFAFMKRLLILLLTACCLLPVASCRFKAKKENSQKEEISIAAKVDMMEADRGFSSLSQKEGLRKAYAEYIDGDGVLLRPGSMPLVGGDAMDFITQSNDTSFAMTWEPKDAALAASGDLGYTFGVYSLKQNGADTVVYGSYVTIWKRQANGKWKFVLQSGNEGVE